MFKKFEDNNVSGVTQLKSSVQKSVRNKIIEQYPLLNDHIDKILPKKELLKVIKCHDHIEILSNSLGDFLFFRHYEGDYIPTLKLIHKYPFICPLMQVDKGAIQFVLQGANIMCPGLTSKGAIMTPNVPDSSLVIIMAEDKQNALAVGRMKMTPENILKVNKGIGVENLHYLNDGLWRMKPVK